MRERTDDGAGVPVESLDAGVGEHPPASLVELSEVLQFEAATGGRPAALMFSGARVAAAPADPRPGSVVDLGLVYRGGGSDRSLSGNVTPEGLTLHYGGDSPWRSGIGSADHARCPAIVRAWHEFHRDGRGWAGFAYSAAVCPHGVIYRGRWAGKRTAAQGTNDGNQRSLAAVYIAGGSDALTGEAAASLRALASSVMLGVPLRWDHADWHTTSCAGPALRRWKANGWPALSPSPTTDELDGPMTPETEKNLRRIVREELGADRMLSMQAEYGRLEDGADGYGEKATAKRDAALSASLRSIERKLDALSKR